MRNSIVKERMNICDFVLNELASYNKRSTLHLHIKITSCKKNEIAFYYLTFCMSRVSSEELISLKMKINCQFMSLRVKND